jgi:acyl carrier protein
MDEPLRTQLERRQRFLDRVRRALIEAARLPFEPDEVDPDAPLFGTGLGLDSVDALELVVAVEREFTVQIPESRVHAGLRTVNTVVDLLLAAGAEERA